MKKIKKFDILIIIAIFLICIGYTDKTFQNDTFYTIKIGESILKNGVDMIDHFSIHNLVYTYPHWLYDLLVYLIFNLTGFQGLYYTTIIIYIIIGLLLYFLNKNLSKNSFISGIFTIAALICLNSFITVRAQIVSYILFIIELFLIEKFMTTNKNKYLICLPIISLLIVNMHCAVWPFFFILFLPPIAEQIICWYKDKEINIKSFHKKSGRYLWCEEKINMLNKKFEVNKTKNMKHLLIIIIVCLLTGFITLNGLTPFTYIINTLKGTTTAIINEHKPAVLVYESNLIFILCISLFALIFLKVKIKLRDGFLLVGLFLLALNSNRHISLLIICGTFVIIRIFSNYLEKNNPTLTELCIKIFTKKSISTFLIILISILSFTNYFNIYNQKYIGKSYPIKAADYIIDNLDTKKIRLFNEYGYGSYLIYKNIPVFIDSRADLYTKEFNNLERDIFNDAYNFSKDYKEIIEYYDITHVIIASKGTEFEKHALYKLLKSESYKIIYEDTYYAIFEIKKV